MEGGAPTKEIQRIVVGVDGSSNSKVALDWAITLARSFSAEVVAVHAVGLLAHLASGPPVPAQAHLEELRSLLEEEWCASLGRSGIRHRTRLVDGAPAMALMEAVELERADLAIVGRRGSGGFTELVMGGTSHQLAERCPCPLVVVPEADR
jgi:nucleotide-binding universal stress UspA family protein